MRTLLICHEDAPLDRRAMPRWLSSFSTLAGVLVIRERGTRKLERARREIRRIGWLRFLDVTAFRIFYRLRLARRDRQWETGRVRELVARYPEVDAPELITATPNSSEAQRFIAAAAPDLVIARCKVLLKEEVFSIPKSGTFVMHPGICPEYRNAHGCFWALVRGDFERVGMTLLRVDRGIDTGRVYGYFSYPYDSYRESHIVIQDRVVFDNLDALAATLERIAAGSATPLDTSGRRSAVWGHPWLTGYLRWKRRARRHGR
jgi:folate-dependent phosphoribosylglycinamide formyltransferase PurN